MTKAEITENLNLAKDAYKKALSAYSYAINSGQASRSITRQQLTLLKEEYLYWNEMLSDIEGKGPARVKFIQQHYKD